MVTVKLVGLAITSHLLARGLSLIIVIVLINPSQCCVPLRYTQVRACASLGLRGGGMSDALESTESALYVFHMKVPPQSVSVRGMR